MWHLARSRVFGSLAHQLYLDPPLGTGPFWYDAQSDQSRSWEISSHCPHWRLGTWHLARRRYYLPSLRRSPRRCYGWVLLTTRFIWGTFTTRVKFPRRPQAWSNSGPQAQPAPWHSILIHEMYSGANAYFHALSTKQFSI